MLREIYCEAFHQKRIVLNKGLSVILGTPTGTNSIGKSTFMLIIDFVLGGETYADKEDIINNVGNHRICWTFQFDDKCFYFARNMPNAKEIEECNSRYEAVKRITVSEYCQWLRKTTNLEIDELSFRSAVGRYIRAYGKDNLSETNPLNGSSHEKNSDAIIELLKLFRMYAPISAIKDQADASKKAYEVFTKAQRQKFIEKINKSEYTKNLKRIEQIEAELSSITEGLESSLLDVDAAASEEAIAIKKDLSRAKRYRSSLLAQTAILEDNFDYSFSVTSNTYKELSAFFPEANLAAFEEIESFHKIIAEIFRKELQEEKARIQETIKDYDSQILLFESQIKDLVHNPSLSKIVLKKHADAIKELERIQKANKSFEKELELKEERNSEKQRLEEIMIRQLGELEKKINREMHRINDIIYGGKFNSPTLTFSGNTYRFFTPNDTGTGIAYKGLVVFDLAVLHLTELPILVHDSIVLKQISDEAIESILEQYATSGKQVIIALDKQDSYTEKATRILEENAVLKLASNGEELFGRSWGQTQQ